MTPKWLWALKGQWYPICTVQVPPSSKFHSFTLRPAFLYLRAISKQVHRMTQNVRFRVTGHFEKSALDDPRMILNAKRSKVLHMHVLRTPEYENFTPFRFAVSLFRVTSHFEKSTPDSNMTLSIKRSKVPHMHVTTTPEFQISPPHFLSFHAMIIHFCYIGNFLFFHCQQC